MTRLVVGLNSDWVTPEDLHTFVDTSRRLPSLPPLETLFRSKNCQLSLQVSTPAERSQTQRRFPGKVGVLRDTLSDSGTDIEDEE